LTKADLVPAGELGQWMKILQNDSKGEHHLLHGYYVTRQLSTEEREKGIIERGEAKEIERNFFLADSVWRGVDQNRLGTWNLANALSGHLTNMIRER
jgi:hypothetical protein